MFDKLMNAYAVAGGLVTVMTIVTMHNFSKWCKSSRKCDEYLYKEWTKDNKKSK